MTSDPSLKSLRGSLERAVRGLNRAKKDVKDIIDVWDGDADQEAERKNLGAKLEVLKYATDNAESLLLQFEQIAAENDDGTYKSDQDKWGDLVYEARGLTAEANQLLKVSATTSDVSLSGDPQPHTSAGSPPSGTVGSDQVLTRLLALLDQRQQNPPQNSVSGQPDLNNGSTPQRADEFCRLPKMDLPKFKGDILKWKPFWDRFTTTVDRNGRLAAVDKFNYLISMLEEDTEPHKLIQSLPITNDNYATAKTLLEEKYGDTRMVIALLYRKLNEMRPVKNEPVALRRFVAEIDCLLGSLSGLGQNTSDDNFATIILSKLPNPVVVSMEMNKKVDEVWTVALVRSKLSEYLIRIDRAAKLSALSTKGPSSEDSEGTADGLTAGESSKRKKAGSEKKKDKKGGKGANGQEKKKAEKSQPTCAFCQGSHYADNCDKFTTVKDRAKQLGDKCRICLAPGHKRTDCKSRKPCFYCKQVGNHHSAFCYQKFGNDRQSGMHAGEKGGDSDKEPDDKDDEDGDSGLLASGEGVALQTARIPIRGVDKNSQEFQETRGLFDPGANRTYCSENLAKKLNMKLHRGPSLKVNRFGSEQPVDIPTKAGKLQVRKLDGGIETIEVSVIPSITGRLCSTPIRSKKLEKLKNRVTLADDLPTSYQRKPVDLLIGSDYYLDFITCEKIPLEKGLYLLGSEFGYILTGRSSLPKSGDYPLAMCGFTCSSVEGLEEMIAIPTADGVQLNKPDVSEFWSLETLGIKDDPEVTADDLAVRNFEENVTKADGRYSVTLPWNERAEELRDNYQLSKGRLNSLVKRLKDDDGLFGTYAGIIEDQLEKGVIEKVNSILRPAKSHYIPHHAVIDPQKETTKVRVVYDGSAKVGAAPSLNECLYRGPVLMEDLAGLLMRFRTHKIGIIADIEKAFLQIGIDPKDRDMLRFLWLKDPSQRMIEGNLQVYRFCRVVFGLNCSPSLLAQTVKHHLKLEGTATAMQISEDLYADNVVTGVETLDDAKAFYRDAKDLFSKASMNLRQFASNSVELMKVIPSEDHTKLPVPKVLGMPWFKDTDELSVSPNSKLGKPVETKRDFLSCLSTIFDPLGLFAPVIVEGKILLQTACQHKPDWDQKLEKEVLDRWETQRLRMEEIPKKRIPRFIPNRGKCQLIAFSDASTSSFATAVYLRCKNGSEVHVNLLMSKSRLNPVKKLTVPRMELMGVLISVRALKFVARQLKMPLEKGLVFSDSSCTLAWLKSEKKQDLFVKNRVKEIAKAAWVRFRYVHTDDNPADLATRGKTVSELTEFWWQGPQWLQKPKSEWPTWAFSEVAAKEPQGSGTPIHQVSMPGEAIPVEPVFQISLDSYSSLLKLVRVTAWCFRFIDRLKKTGEKGKHLTADELDRAKSKWEIYVQDATYGSLKEKLVEKKVAEMGQFSVFVDENGLIRCKGRLEKAELSYGARYPKLLPKGHAYTRLLVRQVHQSNGHPSVSHTLSLLRRQYWIPKGRQLVKSVVHRCVRCNKAAGRTFARPNMPELPPDRVNPQPCFTSTGVDYFGPVKLKGPTRTQKAWVALFTCLTTRAVHLELVLDLSAEEFLMALRRFISRRGKPKTMLSDNAPQFKTVAKAFDVNWHKVVQAPSVLDYSAKEGIQWSFIVEYAPYMGGVYERLVGIVKTCLRKTIGSALLTPKQFETLLCECEAIVNTRPLCYVGADLDDGTVLTPAHFLSLNPFMALSDTPRRLKVNRDVYHLEGPTVESLMESWKKGNRLLSEFWDRWKSEYLSALRERFSYRHIHNQGSPRLPKENEVVLLKESGLPRGSWKIAKIAKVHLGNDGKIRSVSIVLPSGRTLHRPVNLIVPLEVGPEPDIKDVVGRSGPPELDPDDESGSSGRASPEFVAMEGH